MARYFERVSIAAQLSEAHYHVWGLLYLFSGEKACTALVGGGVQIYKVLLLTIVRLLHSNAHKFAPLTN